jgi:hypothetical protein
MADAAKQRADLHRLRVAFLRFLPTAIRLPVRFASFLAAAYPFLEYE